MASRLGILRSILLSYGNPGKILAFASCFVHEINILSVLYFLFRYLKIIFLLHDIFGILKAKLVAEKYVQRILKIFTFVCFWFLYFSTLHASNFAYLVVEGSTGKIMASHRADELRPPASLTKKMTLYLIFEALRSGKITLNTKFTVSKRATLQAPCNLGLRTGQTISVKDIIFALVTRSANDASVVIAEGLAGTVEKFVSQMNQKAKNMGMNRTRFYNTSGLPIYKSRGVLDRTQITTASDMILLARALYKDFPKEYSYFKMKHFYYSGNQVRNHNKMLNSFKGLDGIKTGYTDASRFNISVSAQRIGADGKPIRLFAIVLGGKTSVSRDKKAAELLEAAFSKLHANPLKMQQVAATDDDLDKVLNQADSNDDEKIAKPAHIKKLAKKVKKKNIQKKITKNSKKTQTNQIKVILKDPIDDILSGPPVTVNINRDLPAGWTKPHFKA